MRKKLILIAGVLAALLLILILVIITRPEDFRVSRSTTINAPPVAVFAQVNNFHQWDAWSPWAKLDPNCKVEFEGPASGTGSVFKWSGNNEVGEGSQTIIESRPPELIRIRLEFTKPFEAANDVEFTFQPADGGTLVIWSMSGKNNFVGKAISLVMTARP